MTFSAPQIAFLSTPAEFVVYGGAAGSGKTHALSIDPLRHCQGPHANPEFRGAIFRRTSPELYKPKGLVDHCKSLYGPLGAVYNHTHNVFRFPSGAELSLQYLARDKDKDGFQGAQFDWLAVDEAALFPEDHIFFLQGRSRSVSGIKPVCRFTCNPDFSSWMYPFLSWWIDPNTGFPIPERSGHIRHFLRQDGKIEWFDEEQYDADTSEKVSTSATFFPATLDDNITLDKGDPSYRRKLMSLPPAERERFLDGCWLASSATGAEWPREYFVNVVSSQADWPARHNRNLVKMFAVDPSKGRRTKRGDYSAIVCAAVTSDLIYVDADLEKRDPTKIVEDLFVFCQRHEIRTGDLIGMEALQFQSLFHTMVYQYAAENPDFLLSKYLLAGNDLIEIEDTTPKPMRIRRLSKYWAERRFRFSGSVGSRLLLGQAQTFDGTDREGQHDDGLDALDMTLQLPIQRSLMYERRRERAR